jgi:hypothetical protein
VLLIEAAVQRASLFPCVPYRERGPLGENVLLKL